MPDDNATAPVKTKLYLVEFAFLHQIYKSSANIEPRFAFPDLISACVSLVFAEPHAKDRLFDFVRTTVIARNREGRSASRYEGMWAEQFELLREVQTDSANRYPNPQFSLGDFTSACVALVMREKNATSRILAQARVNFANRVAAGEALGGTQVC